MFCMAPRVLLRVCCTSRGFLRNLGWQELPGHHVRHGQNLRLSCWVIVVRFKSEISNLKVQVQGLV